MAGELAAIAGGMQQIGGALALPYAMLGDHFNRQWQTSQNQADRDWQLYMYNLERGHALEDWSREAAYNSPEQQMTRLRQAGLNPHLIYGKGADATMGSVRGTNVPLGKQPAKTMDPGLMMQMSMGSASIAQLQAQTDNLHTQNGLIQAQQVNTAAQTARTMQETARSEYDLALSKELRDMVIEQAEANLHATWMGANKQAHEISRMIQEQEQLHPVQMHKLNVELRNAEIDGRLKAAELELREQGINPSDPTWLRMLMKIILKTTDYNSLFK